MNLNKMFVFIFVFFGFFSALLVTMPTQFVILGVGANVQDKEAVDFFNEHNVTAYNQTLSLNLTCPGSEKRDYGLPEGQQLEFWWSVMVGTKIFQVRHLTDNFWGWWWGYHMLTVQEPYRSKLKDPRYPDTLVKEDVVTNLFDEDYNASYCEFACGCGISLKLFIMTYNQSWTLSESWDNNKLKLFTSYDIDWTKTGTSMWHIMGQLLAFQNPNLGVPGVFGYVLNKGLSLLLTASVLLLFFALITSVIPFIRGWVGGGG